ncbi:oxidoreductase [Oleiagrimonas sp. C23AA]|uniref:oxidoreductase n=1 Tax=Oleiagrimonas sp. C23AA TaxID=2719047 RepID=UPI0014233CC7|nr:oxidoreductase [Oleiagrimonas sp. C23AA]NII09278.1 oxidoreductase [Oleiagrimonas sp. C23AA]
MSPVSTGLIGFGLAGSAFHAPILDALSEFRVDAVVSSRHEAIATQLPQAAIVPQVDMLLNDTRIELVIIATPDRTHAPLAQAALEAGKHVVVDKPFCLSSTDADALIELATRKQRVLSIYQNRRWDGDFRTVQSLIKSGRMGQVSYFESHFDRFRPTPKNGWRERPDASEGVLFDLGAHLVDQALVLFGAPDTLIADITVQREKARVCDYLHMVLGYGKRRVVLHASTLAARPGPRFLVHGDAASYVKFGMDPQEAALRAGSRPQQDPHWGEESPEAYGQLHDGEGQVTSITTQPGDYRGYYRALAGAIRQGAPVPVSAVQARNVIAVLEAARESARQGRRLTPTLV